MSPVHGQVLLDGKPLSGAMVTFICPNAQRFSSGTTDAEGKFTLTTFTPNDGALIGENAVTVTLATKPPPETAGNKPDPEAYFRALHREQARVAASTSTLPLRYADARTSHLTCMVKPDNNQPVLKLQRL
jgi:hypothetical protein